MTFEEQIMQEIKNNILRTVGKEVIVKVDYQQRQAIPKEFIEQVWASVDWSAVLEQIKPEIQNRICNAIIGNMETEIKTDVKSILSVDGVRQKLRMQVYPQIIAILDSDIKKKVCSNPLHDGIVSKPDLV
jgi:hypothetical protein